MLKHLIALVSMSFLIIFSMSYAQQGVELLLAAHNSISDFLVDIFSGGKTGNMIRTLIALLSIPVLAGLIPAVLYWAIRRHWFPYFMQIVWVVWLIQAGALVVLYKAAS